MNIQKQRIQYPDASKQSFESMKTYLNMSRKYIRYFVTKYDARLRDQMLKSEDAISNIATQLMMADWRWNPNRRSSTGKVRTRSSYRTQCALFAIQSYINSISKTKKLKSLDYAVGADFDIELKDMISDVKAIEPIDELIKREVDIESILNRGGLTNKQRECIKLYYLEQKTMHEISLVYNITKEAVRQNIVKGIAKLKNQLS